MVTLLEEEMLCNSETRLSLNTKSCKKALTSNPTFLRFAFFMALFFKTSSLATENVPTCKSIQIKQQKNRLKGRSKAEQKAGIDK
jgi:hypothetical protein